MPEIKEMVQERDCLHCNEPIGYTVEMPSGTAVMGAAFQPYGETDRLPARTTAEAFEMLEQYHADACPVLSRPAASVAIIPLDAETKEIDAAADTENRKGD